MKSFSPVNPKDFVPRSFEIFYRKNGAKYGLSSLGKDCIAGLTVGVIAMPLAMAFSIAAGASPAQGLYTAIIAGFFISLLGGSKFQIGGPTGAFVVIIFGIISRQGMNGLITASILAGIWLIIIGVTGLGRLVKFIPYPVTTGFTTGIGLLIFSQQIKDFFGLSPESASPAFLSMWAGYIKSFSSFSPVTLGLGLGTLAVILFVRRFTKRIPGVVAGVIAATLVSVIFSLPVETIGSRFGEMPSALPLPIMPDFSWLTIKAVLRDSIAIAMLAAIESLLSAVVADGMSGDRHNSNMELAAQGVANIACAFFGGIPATGAIARTAANIKSGAVSPVAGMIHAITLLLFVLFLAPLASTIPLVSLSAVLIVVSWDMADIPRFVRIFIKAPKSDIIVLSISFVLTVLVDLTFAVEVGVVLSAFMFLKRMVEVTEIKPRAKSPENETTQGNTEESAAIPAHAKNIEVYEITGPFFFGVADSLQDTLRIVEKQPRAFVLRMKDASVIDSTGIAALESFLMQCRHKKTLLVLSEIQEQPMKALAKAGFVSELGEENIKSTLKEAIELAESY